MPSPTPSQQQAIVTAGNVLVMAGAGTGKTRTLVERCVNRLLDPVVPCSLDEILVVTFTEAAAAEMKRRLRRRLSEELVQRPANGHLAEQLALVDSAPIGTLHSICLRLIRDHFHELGLDPQLSVLEESRALILEAETLTTVLEGHYRGHTADDEAVRELILTYGEGRDEPIRGLVIRIHNYAQTLPNSGGWLAALETAYGNDAPPHWEAWLCAGFEELRAEWAPILSAHEHPILRACAGILDSCPRPAGRADLAAACLAVRAADDEAVWKGTKSKTTVRKQHEAFFTAADFLGSLAERTGGGDPMIEDWERVRPHLLTLVRLAREYGAAYGHAKRELTAVDFHDLEQFALRLLWDAAAGRPTALARDYAARFRHVLVDEYQDINAAQDCLLGALSQPAPGNRFLVGDVKQSIYRFRLANPHIFQRYAASWRGGAGQTVALQDNFRSHEAILDFVNALFAGCFHPDIGGVAYDEAARLTFGGRAGRAAQARPADDPGAPRVELLLRLKSRDRGGDDADGADDSAPVLADTEHEARLVAQRLRELKTQSLSVWDDGLHGCRTVTWGDMVILLRAPRQRTEIFAQVFQQAGIPLVSPRRGFYDAIEIADLLNLLTLLDNPLQDLPLLAVLRSPLVAMTLDELAAVRLADRTASLWPALLRFRREGRADADAGVRKAGQFLDRFARWRELVRHGALSFCLETVLDETGYEDWLRAQDRGEQRRANVQRLLTVARQFDQLQHQGLYRFLRFVAQQQDVEYDPEPAHLEAGDAVRLMSIHQSKGLEFPVVVVAALGGGFNRSDLNASVILDESYGLGPLVKAPASSSLYPSLPHWLARRRQWRELLGEEQRLLYVAATRAVERLILVGSAPVKRAAENWTAPRQPSLSPAQILAARSCLDWVGPLLPHLAENDDWLSAAPGQSRLLAWRVAEDLSGLRHGPAADRSDGIGNGQRELPLGESADGITTGPEVRPDADELARGLFTRLSWRYPHRASTTEPAKTSVTALRRRIVEEADEEARAWFRDLASRRLGAPGMTAAERGVAHHKFLQHVAMDRVSSLEAITAEAARLRDAGRLSHAEHNALDLTALATFWAGALGSRVAADPTAVRRELEFTARFPLADLRELGLPVGDNPIEEEYVIIQGVADLVVLRPDALWVLDFKTDDVTAATVGEKARAYAPQLALYARALERIHRRSATEAWLHFLALGRAVEVLDGSPSGASKRGLATR